MTAPDVRQTYDVEILSAMLSPEQYVIRARERGEKIAHRTVQRYLPLGRIEGAWKDERKRWHIPADARVLPESAATPPVVRQASSDVAPPTPDVRLAYPLGMLVTLEDAAASLGTTVGGVRRMARDGHVTIGPWGPHRSPRVWVAP